MHVGVSTTRVTDNYEEKITDGNDQSHGETNRRLATMRRDPKRHPNNREGDEGERKGKAFFFSGLLGLRFLLSSVLRWSSSCSIDNAERLGRFFSFSYSSSRLIGNVPSAILIPSRIFVRSKGFFSSRA